MEDLVVSHADGIASIVINRPHVLNALRVKTIDELIEAVETADAEPTIGVIVIRGAGNRAFSVGGDQKDIVADLDAKRWRAIGRKFHRLFNTIRDTGKPVIAAVNGWCLGGGHELHCFCDLTIATESSKFGQVGPKVGGAPIYVTQALPRIVGDKRAKEILFLCEQYDAREAQRMGLVNRVVAQAEFETAIDDMCQRLLAMSPGALRLIKMGVAYGQALMDSHITGMIESGVGYFGSEEQREGSRAFAEKRAADFRRFRK